MTSLSSYGTLWGAIPGNIGRIFFVSPTATYVISGQTFNASDNHEGLHPNNALRTISQALANCTSGVGDVVMLLAGAHVPTASLAMNKSGVTLMGIPTQQRNQIGSGSGAMSVITGLAGDETINISAINVAIQGIRFNQATAVPCVDFITATGLLIQDCYFQNTATANTGGISISSIGTTQSGVVIRRCNFHTNGANGNFIVASGMTIGSIIEDCKFSVITGTLASAILVGASTTVEINRCRFVTTSGGVITAAINGTGASIAGSAIVNDCRFGLGCTVPVDNFDATEAQLSQNYKAEDTGGTGDTKVSLTT